MESTSRKRTLQGYEYEVSQAPKNSQIGNHEWFCMAYIGWMDKWI